MHEVDIFFFKERIFITKYIILRKLFVKFVPLLHPFLPPSTFLLEEKGSSVHEALVTARSEKA